MSKVTSKLQLTLPKRLAEKYGIYPGDEIEFVAAGDVIHLVPPARLLRSRMSAEERMRLFEARIRRQREREKRMKLPVSPPKDRGWKREDLYTRGDPD